MEISDPGLGAVLVLTFFLIGFAFSSCFWRYHPLTVTQTMELKVLADDAIAISVKAMTAARIRGITVEPAGRSVSGRTGLTMRPLGTQCCMTSVQPMGAVASFAATGHERS